MPINPIDPLGLGDFGLLSPTAGSNLGRSPDQKLSTNASEATRIADNVDLQQKMREMSRQRATGLGDEYRRAEQTTRSGGTPPERGGNLTELLTMLLGGIAGGAIGGGEGMLRGAAGAAEGAGQAIDEKYQQALARQSAEIASAAEYMDTRQKEASRLMAIVQAGQGAGLLGAASPEEIGERLFPGSGMSFNVGMKQQLENRAEYSKARIKALETEFSAIPPEKVARRAGILRDTFRELGMPEERISIIKDEDLIDVQGNIRDETMAKWLGFDQYRAWKNGKIDSGDLTLLPHALASDDDLPTQTEQQQKALRKLSDLRSANPGTPILALLNGFSFEERTNLAKGYGIGESSADVLAKKLERAYSESEKREREWVNFGGDPVEIRKQIDKEMRQSIVAEEKALRHEGIEAWNQSVRRHLEEIVANDPNVDMLKVGDEAEERAALQMMRSDPDERRWRSIVSEDILKRLRAKHLIK